MSGGTLSDDLFGLAQAACALALLAALVWLVRRTRFGAPFAGKHSRLLQIEERLAVDMHNGLLVVRVEGRRLLLAVSGQGPARLVTELAPVEPPRA